MNVNTISENLDEQSFEESHSRIGVVECVGESNQNSELTCNVVNQKVTLTKHLTVKLFIYYLIICKLSILLVLD